MKRFVLAVAGLVALGACTGSGGPGAPDAVDVTSSLAFQVVAPPDFEGNAVLLSGARLSPADGKYPCASALAPICVPFDGSGDGALKHKFDDLCPSPNVPQADWHFYFTFYSDKSCSAGSKLTGDSFNCYDLASPSGFLSPNSAVRPLAPGLNPTKILCVSKPPPPSWDLSLCSAVTTADDLAANQVRYDCGCTAGSPDALTGTPACTCSQGGAEPLPSGCAFASDCTVVCPGTAP